jgi:hypothetical protein
MTPDWDGVWEKLSAVFRRLADEVARENAAAWSASGRTSTDVFPFGAYLSFNRSGEPGVEDVVISVDGKRDGGEIVLSIDIAAGDGLVLAEGPAVRMREEAIGRKSLELAAWVDGVARFIQLNRNLIRSRLGIDVSRR